jgi:hypothetical protein
MKSTDQFKKTIQQHLEKRALEDSLFASTFNNPDKNIDDCVTYILNTVHKIGCGGFTDDEVFSMAIHYYDEQSIEIGAKIKCEVVVNHAIVLSEEEKAEARKLALDKYQEEIASSFGKKPVVKKEKPIIEQTSLFD